MEHGADTSLQSQKHKDALSHAQESLADYKYRSSKGGGYTISLPDRKQMEDKINNLEQVITILQGAELPNK